MKIDLMKRIKNPIFNINLIGSLIFTVLAYFNLKAEDITTFPKLYEIIKLTVSNPYLLCMIIFNIWGIIYDPTTKGVGDSDY